MAEEIPFGLLIRVVEIDHLIEDAHEITELVVGQDYSHYLSVFEVGGVAVTKLQDRNNPSVELHL